MSKKHRKKWEQKNQVCIHINHQICWVCGDVAEDHHHAIPKRLKPLNNVHIPVCKDCHDLLHPEKHSQNTGSGNDGGKDGSM